MSSTSDSITWEKWSRKWGNWTTWLQKLNALGKPAQQQVRLQSIKIEKLGTKVRKTSNTGAH